MAGSAVPAQIEQSAVETDPVPRSGAGRQHSKIGLKTDPVPGVNIRKSACASAARVKMAAAPVSE
jgi:hypothetical protein